MDAMWLRRIAARSQSMRLLPAVSAGWKDDENEDGDAAAAADDDGDESGPSVPMLPPLKSAR